MKVMYCPRCNRVVYTPTNRLITEKCGHVKCRECFINDINGCYECCQEPVAITANTTIHTPLQNVQLITTTAIPIDIESDSRELCIDTEVDDSTTCEGPTGLRSTDTNFARMTETPNSVNVIHNYTTPESQKDANESAESLKILEEYIIPPKSKIEKFFRETKINSGLYERKKGISDYVVKIVENGETCYKCNVCGKKFTSRSHQYYHAHCGNGGAKRHKCKFCSKLFFSSSHLNYHVKSHHENGKYPCNICSKTFKHSMNLRRHKRTHDGIYKYKCRECELGFREAKTYTAHLNKHRNIFPFVCKICGKKFSFKSNLTQHQKIHSGSDKHFRCEECGRDFVRKNSYTEHMNRHTKVKNFQCKLCETLFIDRKTMERHMHTHGSKYYKCPRCDVKCGRKDNLVRHIRNMHPDENIPDILQNIKTILLTSKSNPKSNRTRLQEIDTIKKPTPDTDDMIDCRNINENQQQILASTSVIRSVGNVKPVRIPNDCNLQRNLMKIESLEKSSTHQTNICESTSNNNQPQQQQTSNQSTEIKKPKKKYDPCEIYRKILFATDVDDSVLESEDVCPDSKDDHNGCCNVESETFANTSMLSSKTDGSQMTGGRTVENPGPLNFGEIHWRKRTSQNFYTSL